jgi:hypothetical protein
MYFFQNYRLPFEDHSSLQVRVVGRRLQGGCHLHLLLHDRIQVQAGIEQPIFCTQVSLALASLLFLNFLNGIDVFPSLMGLRK